MKEELNYKNINRIKEIRLHQEKTLKQVADAVGITDGQLSLYENGKRSPRNKDIWVKLADYFNVPVEYLMGINADSENIYTEKKEELLIKLIKKENIIKEIANINSKDFSMFSDFYELTTKLINVSLDESNDNFEYIYHLLQDIFEYSTLLAKESIIREEIDREKQKKLEKKYYGELSRAQANELRSTLYAKIGALFN